MIVMVQRRIPVRDAALIKEVVKEFDNAQHYRLFKSWGIGSVVWNQQQQNRR